MAIVTTVTLYILWQAKHYTTNNIMMTFGSDFNFESAVEWFKNIDKLIKYVNKASTPLYYSIIHGLTLVYISLHVHVWALR